jgi:hypothetical protein
LAGVMAGLGAWLGGEACIDLIKPPLHPVNSRGVILNVTFHREEVAAETKNAGLAFMFLGAFLGASLGVAGGLIRRSGRGALRAGLLGLTLGAAAAAGMSLALLPRYHASKNRNPDEALRDLIYPLLIHVGIWSTIGAAAGIAYGVGLGKSQTMPVIVLGALAGAALGTVAYELVGALALPEAQTARFVSVTWLAVTLVAAAGAALAAAEVQKPAVPSVP